MTSLTTILALVPFLFMPGLGTDLQLPMSITIISGMIIGTFVSLFLIPILYKKLKQ
jgi:multidrug efflux pump subunit AcrB